MESTRIYKILQGLSASQQNRFLKFIKSPYHNVNARIEQLAVYLIENTRNKAPLLSKEDIWSKVELKVAYSDLKFRKLCNELLERFEKYLIIENLETNKILQSNLLLDSIRKNKHELLAEKHIAKSSKSITRVIDQSSEYYLQKYFYEKTIQNLKTNYEKKVDLKKGKARSYSELTDNLDAFYTIEKLRIAIDQQTWKKMYKTEEQFDLGIPISQINQYNISKYSSVKIYKLMYELYLEDEATEKYYSLKSVAMTNINTFPKDEQRGIFDVLVSYCIKFVNKGDLNFLKETLDLYDWGISQSIILNKGKLSPTTFRNYVVAGLRVGEYEKVENFISQRAELLDEDRKENAVNFNLARLAFYRKEFQKVIEYLSKVNYDDIWYNVNSRTLLLAAYYELEEYDTLESNLDTFFTFLRREKSLGDTKRKSYKSFITYLKKLQNSSNNKKKLIELKEKIKLDKNVTTKQWLLEKIDELLPIK